ncbi:MAG: hypothetical protein H6738_23235 [Alphaproteobacteria bacterium]|nr:hypothetical protein [Alphaproteobacteria bacterium]MCB9699719.1 hypothetical protein [Alphaproteobacteria bacterium]
MWQLLTSAAHACSVFCGNFGDSRLILPADGDAGVPTDAVVVLADARTPVLRDPDGVDVPVDLVAIDATLTRLVPKAPMAPGWTYAVVDDLLQTELAVVGSFTVGEGPASGPPPSAPTDLVAEGFSQGDLWPGRKGLTAMCGNLGDGVWLGVDWAPVTGLYQVEARRKDQAPVLLTVGGEATELGWNTPCLATLPDLRKGEEVSIRVRAVDEVGRTGPFSEELFTSVRDARSGGCSTGPSGAGGAALLLVLLSSRTSGCRWRRRARS